MRNVGGTRWDVCRPVDAIAAPVIVFFYGGAWRGGNKELYRYVAKALARRGYVAVIPDYRIYPEVCYPEFIEDGALAVRWVKDTRRRYVHRRHRAHAAARGRAGGVEPSGETSGRAAKS